MPEVFALATLRQLPTATPSSRSVAQQDGPDGPAHLGLALRMPPHPQACPHMALSFQAGMLSPHPRPVATPCTTAPEAKFQASLSWGGDGGLGKREEGPHMTAEGYAPRDSLLGARSNLSQEPQLLGKERPRADRCQSENTDPAGFLQIDAEMGSHERETCVSGGLAAKPSDGPYSSPPGAWSILCQCDGSPAAETF